MVQERIRENKSIVLPDKKYFKIGEAATLLGVKPHVLRYWETEFPQIRPYKSKTGQRLYRKCDVEALLKIQKLLYEERFTIAGARQALRLNNWTRIDDIEIDEADLEESSNLSAVINPVFAINTVADVSVVPDNIVPRIDLAPEINVAPENCAAAKDSVAFEINTIIENEIPMMCVEEVMIEQVVPENVSPSPAPEKERELDPDISRLLSIPLLSARKKLQEILQLIDG